MAKTAPSKRLLILPGDGIGPDILAQTRRIVDWFEAHRELSVDLREEHFGIPAWHAHGSLLRDETWAEIEAADAVLSGLRVHHHDRGGRAVVLAADAEP